MLRAPQHGTASMTGNRLTRHVVSGFRRGRWPRSIARWRKCIVRARGDDGLFAIVRARGLDPFSGNLFAFIGKHRDRIKILVWHRGGFVLLYGLRLRCWDPRRRPRVRGVAQWAVSPLLGNRELGVGSLARATDPNLQRCAA